MPAQCAVWRGVKRVVWLVVMLVMCVNAFADPTADSDGRPKPLPESVVAAWRAAGAEVGWMGPRAGNSGPWFRAGREGGRGEVPAFSVGRRWTADLARSLPQPQQAFDLELNGSDFSQADLDNLKEFKELQAVRIGGTVISRSEFRGLLNGRRWSSRLLLIGLVSLAMAALILAAVRRTTPQLWGVAVVLVGVLIWGFADWRVYFQETVQPTFMLVPQFKLNGFEQVALSALGGGLVALAFFVISSSCATPVGRRLGIQPALANFDQAALGSAIAGVVACVTSIYLSGRVGGDLFAHFYFVGIQGLDFWLLAPVSLCVCEIVALCLAFSAARSRSRKAAIAVGLITAPIWLLGVGGILMMMLRH